MSWTQVGALIGRLNWGSIATVVAALVAAGMSWRALVETRRTSGREQAFVRFGLALDHLYSGDPSRAEQGKNILRSLRNSGWLDDADRTMVVEAIRTYRRMRAGGST